MKVLIVILVSLVLWPLEALVLMWGLDISEHYGFALPTLGYWQCFGAQVGLSLILSSVLVGREAQKALSE